MDYKQTLETLYNMLPDFQQVGVDAYKPGLGRIRAFAQALGDPQNRYMTVHVAGTNGKGSVSHMLASVLTAAGYRTGLYTSPHLWDFRERIRIDGEMISQEEVVGFAARWMDEMKRRDMSFFEATAAMAFEGFARHGVDIAVIETGLGGRLDATNIISPVLSVITNIALDHTALLGETRAEIAREKAGIIKPGVPVVVGERDTETDPVLRKAAEKGGSPILFAGELFRYIGAGGQAGMAANGEKEECHPVVYDIEDLRTGTSAGYPCDLAGVYQRSNIVTALAAVETLRGLGAVTVSGQALARGLATTALSTGLRGRWEVLGRRPLVVCDTGHNPHGITEVVRQIRGERFRNLYMVIGFVRDKDIASIFPLLPQEAYYIFTSPSIRRAMPAHELAAMAAGHGLGGIVAETVTLAVGKALSMAGPEDMVFIGGSTFVVADIEMPS